MAAYPGPGGTAEIAEAPAGDAASAVEEASPAEAAVSSRRGRPQMVAATIYLLAACTLLAIQLLVGDRTWWGALGLALPGCLLLPPGLLLLMLAVRRGPAWWVTAAALLVAAGPLMGAQLHVPRSASGARLRVLTWNLREGAPNLDRSLALIRREAPDLVVLTEARGFGPGRRVRRRLSNWFAGWSRIGVGDLFLASRHPLIESDYKALPDPASGSQKARLKVQSPLGPLHVVGAHLPARVSHRLLRGPLRELPARATRAASLRRREIVDLRNWTAHLQGSMILAGDFNLQPLGPPYASVRGPLLDAFQQAGLGAGATYPAALPLVRIDYILHTRDLRALTCRTGPAAGSDHLPVIADLVRR